VAGGLESRGGVEVPVVADAPLEDDLLLDLRGGAAAGEVNLYLLRVDEVDLDAPLLGRLDDGLLFPPDDVV